MASGDIKILDKLSINQNIIGLVISYIGVVYIARLDVDNSALYCLVSFIGNKFDGRLCNRILEKEMV